MHFKICCEAIRSREHQLRRLASQAYRHKSVNLCCSNIERGKIYKKTPYRDFRNAAVLWGACQTRETCLDGLYKHALEDMLLAEPDQVSVNLTPINASNSAPS